VVFYKDQRMGEALPLDPVANDRSPPRPESLDQNANQYRKDPLS
jgi:hypothetical protein